MESYDTGYEDERFQHPVGPSFHCCICTNVIKDPVMCRHNEHIFCRACIIRHLMNYQTCPTCMEPLTVETLQPASRTVINFLSELKIRCEFFSRGCGKFIELGDIENHVRKCGFAPVVCSNEGCQLEVNKQDLLHHETSVCEQRRVKCHSCKEIKQEIDTVKGSLAEVNKKLDRNVEKIDGNEKKLERTVLNVKALVENAVAKVEFVQEQLNKQEERNRRLEANNVEIKKSLNEIMKQLKTMTQQTSHEVQAEEEQMKKGIAEAVEMDRELKVVVAGGFCLNSVEMFSPSDGMWTPLQPMKKCRHEASLVIHNNQLFVMGGSFNFGGDVALETLSVSAIHSDQSKTWETFPAELPGQLRAHSSVVYNGQLILIGGFESDKGQCSNKITEISLVPPYASKLLSTMPQRRLHHGAALFDNKVVIVGGMTRWDRGTNLKTVLLYDFTKNRFQKLAPLPYSVSEMATVKWDDDNIIIAGGLGSNDEALNKVLMYNIKTQKSQMLPDMKYKRYGCVAVVVRDTVIVMGGDDNDSPDGIITLKSVESFRFDRNSWEELPEMNEVRSHATACVC